MSALDSLYGRMVATQRAQACGAATMDAVRAASRAYDLARDAEERAADTAARLGRKEAVRARIAQRLALPIPQLSGAPIGLVSRARAQYLMMAPAVAETGAIYVGIDAGDLVGRCGAWYLADGTIGDQPVADGVVLQRIDVVMRLRGLLAQWARTAPIALEGEIEAVTRVLDAVERRGRPV